MYMQQMINANGWVIGRLQNAGDVKNYIKIKKMLAEAVEYSG